MNTLKEHERKKVRGVLWAILVSVVAFFFAAVVVSCSDDDNTFISPVIGKAVPQKCIDDPCLPGCVADDHIFECDPLVCLCDDAIICVCEDDKPPCLYEGTLLESTLC